jgi:hypothetical protein
MGRQPVGGSCQAVSGAGGNPPYISPRYFNFPAS